MRDYLLINELFGRWDGQEAIEDKALSASDLESLIFSDDDKDDTPSKKNAKESKPDKVEVKEEEEEIKIVEDDNEDEEDEEEIKLKEDEDEEEDKEEEKGIYPVKKADIVKKYPNLFKDFPVLEHRFYAYPKYAEIFPTVEDAQEASEKAVQLDTFSNDIMKGNLIPLFNSIKSMDGNTLNQIADNLIETITKVDEQAGFHVASNVIKHVLTRALNTGKRRNNEELQIAAEIINEFVFDEKEIKPPTKLGKETPKDETISQERQQFEQERFNNALESLQTKVDNSIMSTLDANIDPKNSMTSQMKKYAVRDASEKIENAIKEDRQFQRSLDSLWKSAKAAKYSKDSLERIKSAYLSKARSFMPIALKEARAEALKDSGHSSNNEEREKKGPLPRHGNSAAKSNSGNVKSMPKGMSMKDFLMSD